MKFLVFFISFFSIQLTISQSNQVLQNSYAFNMDIEIQRRNYKYETSNKSFPFDTHSNPSSLKHSSSSATLYLIVPGIGYRYDFDKNVSNSIRLGAAFEIDAHYVPGWAFFSFPGADFVFIVGKEKNYFELDVGPRAYVDWGFSISPAFNINFAYRLQSRKSNFIMRVGGGVVGVPNNFLPSIFLSLGKNK